jgi:hypothetical protein
MASGELKFRGIDLVRPVNRILSGFCSVAVNLRAYFAGGVTFRNLLTAAIYTLGAAVHTIRRLNDLTPNAPASGFSIISGAGTVLSAWNSTIGVKNVATGLSGNPESMVPFRPNASVQPWMYVSDSAAMGLVTLHTQYLGLNSLGPSGTPVNFVSNGMMKVSCNDGYTGTPTPTAVCWKMGIAEPPLAPIVSTENTGVTTTGTLDARAIPWTNYTGANSSYNYGESLGYPHPVSGRDGVAPYTVNCKDASTITVTLGGSATINGGAATPSTNGPSTGSATNPGHYVMVQGTGMTPPTTASVVIGAFTDGSGNVIPAGVAPLYIPAVVDVGMGGTINVPYGAQALQIGINSNGNVTGPGFSANSGSFSITVTVTTDALPSVVSILGTLTLSYWGDSPTTGGVSEYIWRNPDDPGGSGVPRSISTAVGNTTGNSFIFDASFGAAAVPPQLTGIPGLPGTDMITGISDVTVAMLWAQLTPESVVSGSLPVFASPITVPAPQNTNNTTYGNFNFCLTGNLYFPSGGNFTLVLGNKDDLIWGIGGGVTLVSATGELYQYNTIVVPTTLTSSTAQTPTLSDDGQTITVANGYPLLPRAYWKAGDGGKIQQTTVVVSVPAAGIYPIEIDYDFWYHSGRILLLMATPYAGAVTTDNPISIIPPLTAGVKQQVQYRYVYRSSATGAVSNPSPESTAESIPVTANTISSIWSPDPQVDVVDYYRIDSVTSEFTYVNTGPNDNLGGGGTNTPVTDSLLDTELGTQLLEYDNFEPFPSIDLPQKGTCYVSGGLITWVSGGAIGGSATGFNIRWLAGTEILIGSPTSLAYTFIARPTSGTSVTIPGVPDGGSILSPIAYEIPEPILAAQPLPYLFGPTDNVNFCFGVGDPLRPGTLYWCKGSNLDSAPDTNQQEICSPAEPLINGAIAGGLGVLFSIKRAWLIVPSSGSAVATATGTVGSIWNLQESSITRGLYIPRCVCVSGGGLIFFRVSDGIHVSSYGSASQSISDDSLYPLFAHESSDSGTSVPQAITREGVTIYPPDDSQPEKQRFSCVNQFVYWDYIGLGDGNPHTLVYDMENHAWIWDLYTPAATIHATNEGQSVQGVLVGCGDFTVRQMASSGIETITGTVMTPAIGGRGYNHVGIMVIEYSSTSTVTLNMYPADEGNGSYGPPTITLPSTGGALTKYWLRPGANKYKLSWFQFSSTVPFILNFAGTIAFQKSWGSTGEYTPIPIFGGAGGEG